MKILKDIRKNAVIIILITMIVIFLVLKKDFNDIVKVLSNLDLKYIFIALIMFFIYIYLRSYICYKTVNDKRFTLKESVKHNIIVQFFNGITPFSSGGQPMEVYMLTEHGINANKGTMYILQNFIFYQIALVIFGLGAVIYNAIYDIFPKVPLLRELVLIGFIINSLVAAGILFISISKKFTRFVIRNVIRFLYKIRVIKDKEKTREKWRERLDEFHECATILRKRKKLFFIGVLFNILSLACFYIIPMFVAYSMGDFTSLQIKTTLTASAYVLLIGAFVPIPGASGGIEYGFLAFFGNFLSSSKASAVLLVWRFITYYLPMIIGAITFNIDERKN